MQSNLVIPVDTVVTFLLVLLRISGAFIFVPFPGTAHVANQAKAVLCVATAVAVWPQAARLNSTGLDAAMLAGMVLAEMVIGLSVGLIVSVAVEAFQFGAQMLSLQAGLSFASTIDPTTEAESTVLATIAQLMAGCFFFVFGIDGHVLRALVHSLSTLPLGHWGNGLAVADKVTSLLGSIFVTGFLIMIPVIGFLILLDVMLALLGRIHAQLQLLSLAFPMKLMAVTLLLSWICFLFPLIYERFANRLDGWLLSVLRA
jgi:flagellar biosynthetic protein FliR